MSQYYRHHVFFCLNQREPDAPRPSCANCNAQAMQEYAKKRVKALGLAGPGQVRINKAGCLDRCEDGPTVVVYPEGDISWLDRNGRGFQSRPHIGSHATGGYLLAIT